MSAHSRYRKAASQPIQTGCMQGDVAEAQQLFQQAMSITEQAQPQAELNTASEDEWETSMPNMHIADLC